MEASLRVSFRSTIGDAACHCSSLCLGEVSREFPTCPSKLSSDFLLLSRLSAYCLDICSFNLRWVGTIWSGLLCVLVHWRTFTIYFCSPLTTDAASFPFANSTSGPVYPFRCLKSFWPYTSGIRSPLYRLSFSFISCTLRNSKRAVGVRWYRNSRPVM